MFTQEKLKTLGLMILIIGFQTTTFANTLAKIHVSTYKCIAADNNGNATANYIMGNTIVLDSSDQPLKDQPLIIEKPEGKLSIGFRLWGEGKRITVEGKFTPSDSIVLLQGRFSSDVSAVTVSTFSDCASASDVGNYYMSIGYWPETSENK